MISLEINGMEFFFDTDEELNKFLKRNPDIQPNNIVNIYDSYVTIDNNKMRNISKRKPVAVVLYTQFERINTC